MYRELALLDIEKNNREICETLYKAFEYELSGICLFPNHVNIIKHDLPHGLTLSTPIDYPYGISDTSCRNHLILSAIRQGVNAIDLMVSINILINRQYKKVIQDIYVNKKICDDNGITLRIALDHRLLPNNVTTKIIQKLEDVGIEYILPSSGFFLEDFDDSLILAKNTQSKTKIAVILTSNFTSPKELKLIEDAKIFGIRVKSLYSLKSIKDYHEIKYDA